MILCQFFVDTDANNIIELHYNKYLPQQHSSKLRKKPFKLLQNGHHGRDSLY